MCCAKSTVACAVPRALWHVLCQEHRGMCCAKSTVACAVLCQEHRGMCCAKSTVVGSPHPEE